MSKGSGAPGKNLVENGVLGSEWHPRPDSYAPVKDKPQEKQSGCVRSSNGYLNGQGQNENFKLVVQASRNQPVFGGSGFSGVFTDFLLW